MIGPPRLTTVMDLQCRPRHSEARSAIRRRSTDRPATTALLLVVAMVGLVSMTGCGKEARVKVAPVHGRVVYRGQGVPNATVLFFPGDDVAEKAKKMRPFATTNAQGSFQLETYVDGDGAPLGTYQVSIIAVSNTPSAQPHKDRRIGDESASSAPAVTIPAEVTKKYGSVDTSGIKVTVQEGENNLEPFAL